MSDARTSEWCPRVKVAALAPGKQLGKCRNFSSEPGAGRKLGGARGLPCRRCGSALGARARGLARKKPAGRSPRTLRSRLARRPPSCARSACSKGRPGHHHRLPPGGEVAGGGGRGAALGGRRWTRPAASPADFLPPRAAGRAAGGSGGTMSAGDAVCTGWLVKSPPERKLQRYVSAQGLGLGTRAHVGCRSCQGASSPSLRRGRRLRDPRAVWVWGRLGTPRTHPAGLLASGTG